MASSMTADVASAINDLLHLDEADQASLLDVIEDYFISPSSHSSLDTDSESDSDNELDHVAGNWYEFNKQTINNITDQRKTQNTP